MNDFLNFNIDEIISIAEFDEENSYQWTCNHKNYDGFLIALTNGFIIINDKKYPLEYGTIALLYKGDKFAIKYEKRHSIACDFLYDPLIIFPKTSRISHCSKQQINTLLEIIRLWQTQIWESKFICRIHIMLFLSEIFKQNREYTNNIDEDVKTVIQYIHENFKHNFTMNDLQKISALSPSQLRSKFLNQIGYTIIEYRDSLRLHLAKEFLQNGLLNITEIASELGYCDVYHFSKFFKKQTGMPPKAFAKKRTSEI